MITTIMKQRAIKIGKELLKKKWENEYCDDCSYNCILQKGGELLGSQTCKRFNQAIIGEEVEEQVFSCNVARMLVINKLKTLSANTRIVKI